MMTQDECLASPHHFTHDNGDGVMVCYPGSVAFVQLSAADHPQPLTFTVTSVPEPATGALFALALILGFLSMRIRAQSGTKLG